MKVAAGRYCYLPMLLMGLLAPTITLAQQLNHASWKVDVVRLNDREAMLRFDVAIDSGWHVYSQGNAIEDIRIQFLFEKTEGYDRMGSVTEEITAVEKFDYVFGKSVKVFEHHAVFAQRIMLHNGHQLVKGSIRFVVGSVNSSPKAQGLSFSVGVSTTSRSAPKIVRTNN